MRQAVRKLAVAVDVPLIYFGVTFMTEPLLHSPPVSEQPLFVQ